jgi:small GTP-binding protein
MGDPEQIKVVLLGETGVGKTSIISQFTTHTFDPHRETSLSAQFISKTVDFQDIGQSIKFDIWDTVGQEKYRSLAKIFYKDAKVIIFVYDITRPETFEGLKNYWYDETKNNTDGEPILAVVANKIDLYANSKVSNNDGKAFADQIGAIFQTTSALSDSGISTLFDNVGKKYLIPGYDYQSEDKQAQEQFLKKKKEDEGKNKAGRNKKVSENKGVKLEKNENKPKQKKGCC